MPTAIVTGATGILGGAIVQALGKDASKWTKVYALSRSKKEDYPSNIEHDFVDLTASADEMANQLQGVEADYCFFAAYLQKDTEEEMSEVNGAMLRNFLDALDITGASKKLKRVLLTTGAKQYGVQLGQTKNPMEETDPWIEGPGRPPNFYYTQQRILAEKSKASGSYDWVVTYPNDVIGVAKGNFMNLVTAIGLYCAISKELGGDLIFPGSETFYTCFDCFTSATIHADFNIWAAETPAAGNQGFNMVNGDTDSWQTLWPKMAKRFGCKIPASQFKVDTQFEGSSIKLADKPPVYDIAATLGIEGGSFANRVEAKIDLDKWSKHPTVLNAWKKLQEKHGLDESGFEKATWSFMNFVLGRNYSLVISMSKARKLGWTGYQDNWDSFEASFKELEEQKILPPLV